MGHDGAGGEVMGILEIDEQLNNFKGEWVRVKKIHEMVRDSGHEVSISAVGRSLNRMLKRGEVNRKSVKIKYGYAYEFKKVK